MDYLKVLHCFSQVFRWFGRMKLILRNAGAVFFEYLVYHLMHLHNQRTLMQKRRDHESRASGGSRMKGKRLRLSERSGTWKVAV